MSVYNRKGGAGKSGSLREQFNYYKRQLQNRLIEEQAMKEARGVGTLEGRVKTMFKHLNYEEVYKQGVTRKVGHKTVRFVGEQAVKIQIQSLAQRASKSYQVEQFINNYLSSAISAGISDEGIDQIDRLLHSISADKLTYLIDKGILPSIQFLYATDMSEDELIEDIKNAVKSGVTKEELKELNAKKKQLVKVIKEKSQILGW